MWFFKNCISILSIAILVSCDSDFFGARGRNGRHNRNHNHRNQGRRGWQNSDLDLPEPVQVKSKSNFKFLVESLLSHVRYQRVFSKFYFFTKCVVCPTDNGWVQRRYNIQLLLYWCSINNLKSQLVILWNNANKTVSSAAPPFVLVLLLYCVWAAIVVDIKLTSWLWMWVNQLRWDGWYNLLL